MDLLKRIAALSFFLVTLLWLSNALFLGVYPDFNVFYGGLNAYLHGGNPYLDVEGSVMKFLYPPFALFFFFPLILFPRPLASMIWVGSSIVLLLIALSFLFKIGNRKVISNEFFIISGLTFLMFTVKFNLGMGQFNNVNLLLIVLFLYYLQKKQHALSAITLAFSLLLKIFPLFFLLYLMILRKWKVLIIIIGIGLLGLLLPFLFIKSDIIVHFFTTSFIGTVKSWPLDYYNQALSGFIGRLLGTGETASLIKTCITAVLILGTFIILWIKRKNTKVQLLGFASLLPLTLATLLFSWQHYFVLTIPTLILLYFTYRKRKAGLRFYSLLGLSYILIGSNLPNPQAFPVLIQSHMLWGTLLLLGLSLYEIYHYD